MQSQWLIISELTDAQSLLIAACVVILTTMAGCLVYGIVSAWLVMKYPDLTKRMQRIEGKWDDLKTGMKRAGAWRSEYEKDTPTELKINKDSA